jgi:aerobic carbon-monoxide dehydrogenase medium subunit
MIPAELDYAAPRALDEAVRLLAGTPGAKVLAGGMSLIPALKHRLLEPPLLVDLARIPELDGVSASGGRVRIGARATHAALLAHPALAAAPVFADAAAVIGDVQVRNRGTFGGSLVHADPAADWPAVFLALGGEARMVGPKGRRSVAADDFFVGMLQSALAEDEILVELELRVEAKRAGAAYAKLRQPASGFAIVGAAAQVVADRKGRIDEVRIGVTGVNATPFRALSVEKRLAGQSPDAAALRALCARIDEADPSGDLHASAEYRGHLAGVFVARAVAKALARATS